MAEMYQDLMIQQQEEEARKRKILLEQEEKLAAEILRCILLPYHLIQQKFDCLFLIGDFELIG